MTNEAATSKFSPTRPRAGRSPEEQGFAATKERLRGTSAWPLLRCQTCNGGGLLAVYTIYHDLGNGLFNAEDIEEEPCCDCAGWGVPRNTLLAHADCGPLCEACGDPRDTNMDAARLGRLEARYTVEAAK